VSTDEPDIRRGLVRGMLTLALLFGVPIFGGAGTFDWPQGWICLLLQVLGATALTLVLLRRDPALLAERLKPLSQADQPAWDRILMRIIMAVLLVWLALTAADARRFQWSHVPLWGQVTGAVLQVIGYWIVERTMRENTFLAPVVKLQQERGHRVVSTGPYAMVRHPMYAGGALMFVGFPLLLGSWWGQLGTLAMILLLAVRISREEQVLRQGLPGYDAYAARVRYRLVPGLW
jgi:protein-S-isoprenylcysteine O-methyltransferase Ste14